MTWGDDAYAQYAGREQAWGRLTAAAVTMRERCAVRALELGTWTDADVAIAMAVALRALDFGDMRTIQDSLDKQTGHQ